MVDLGKVFITVQSAPPPFFFLPYNCLMLLKKVFSALLNNVCVCVFVDGFVCVCVCVCVCVHVNKNKYI